MERIDWETIKAQIIQAERTILFSKPSVWLGEGKKPDTRARARYIYLKAESSACKKN